MYLLEERGTGAMAEGFTVHYVILPNGRTPGREFIDSLDEQAAAKVDAFIDRLRVYGIRMRAPGLTTRSPADSEYLSRADSEARSNALG